MRCSKSEHWFSTVCMIFQTREQVNMQPPVTHVPAPTCLQFATFRLDLSRPQQNLANYASRVAVYAFVSMKRDECISRCSKHKLSEVHVGVTRPICCHWYGVISTQIRNHTCSEINDFCSRKMRFDTSNILLASKLYPWNIHDSQLFASDTSLSRFRKLRMNAASWVWSTGSVWDFRRRISSRRTPGNHH